MSHFKELLSRCEGLLSEIDYMQRTLDDLEDDHERVSDELRSEISRIVGTEIGGCVSCHCAAQYLGDAIPICDKCVNTARALVAHGNSLEKICCLGKGADAERNEIIYEALRQRIAEVAEATQ